MDVTMTKKELASVAGYTYRRLYDIDRDLPEGKKLFVKSEDGKYDLAIFVQKWVEYNIARESPDDWEDLEVVKAKHEIVKTEKTELEVARMRGQLIDIQDVQRLWGDIVNTVTQNLIHLPGKVAPLLRMQDNVEWISGTIDAEIRRILEDIAQIPVPEYADIETETDGEEDTGTEQEGDA